jgi:hypothetical protein
MITEVARSIPLCATSDVVVCGGGPAGIAAAIAAARAGARTVLLELQGCLGGVWTAGALTWIIDADNKTGLMSEILTRLEAVGGRGRHAAGHALGQGKPNAGFNPEVMKVVLDAMALEAGVQVRLHTRVTAVLRDPAGQRVTHVLTESTAGREAWAMSVLVDCTGNGDVGALAGCGFDMGRPDSGAVQPQSLLALLTGLDAQAVAPFLCSDGLPWGVPHAALKTELLRVGCDPSYAFPTLFRLTPGLFMLMANHEYGVRCDDADALTKATMSARAEVFRMVEGLRGLGGPWQHLTLVATSAHIGVREGRRLHGLYTVTKDDVTTGARHADAICRATFCVDIHSTDPKHNKGLGGDGVKSVPYDIPLRACVARDVDGLMMAGRCISGDFWAHASYRVTGNAVALGEGVGRAAAGAAHAGVTPRAWVTG